jgi:GTP cyclohydrolase I
VVIESSAEASVPPDEELRMKRRKDIPTTDMLPDAGGDGGPRTGDAGVDLEKLERGVRLILEAIGEDADRPGLLRTPRRVAEMYVELTEGMREDPRAHVVALPGDKHDEMVIVRDIHFASVCEHHLAPFVGRAHIAYIPKAGRIVGLSNSRVSSTTSRAACSFRSA